MFEPWVKAGVRERDLCANGGRSVGVPDTGGAPPAGDREGRARTKENVGVPGTVRTQRRVAVSQGLGGVRGGAAWQRSRRHHPR